MITAYEVSDIAALKLRKPPYKDPVLGVYCGLRLDAEVCGGIGEGGRGMVVSATSCCYLMHNAL